MVTCPLCLELLLVGDNSPAVCLSPCGHRFHLACIVKGDTQRFWANPTIPSTSSRPCPLCRVDAKGPTRTVKMGDFLDRLQLVELRDFLNLQIVCCAMRCVTGIDDEGLQPLFVSSSAGLRRDMYALTNDALSKEGLRLATTRDVRHVSINTNFVYLPGGAAGNY